MQSKLHPNCIQVIDALNERKLFKGIALRPARKVITSCPHRSTSHCLPGANRESAGSLILSTFQGSFNSIFRSSFKSIAKLQKTCREAAEKLQYEQRTSGPCPLPICNISFLPLFELPFAQSPLEETHNEISSAIGYCQRENSFVQNAFSTFEQCRSSLTTGRLVRHQLGIVSQQM